MKCPVCAETIQDEATKCRFCGQVLTKAVRLGWPEFYRNCAGLGYLDPGMLLTDYEEHLGLDLNDSCLAAGDPFGNAISYGDESTFEAERCRIDALLEAFSERLAQLKDGTPEGLVLSVMSVYLRVLRKYHHEGLRPEMMDDPNNLRAAADSLHRFDGRFGELDDRSRSSIENYLTGSTQSLLHRAGN